MARVRRTLGAAILTAGAVLLIAALLGPITDLIARHDVSALPLAQRAAHLQNARETARTQILTLSAGIFAGAALLFTALNFTLARQGQVTTRYTDAISQLGSGNLDVRIGGIYALERIARDSARDHSTIMEVLSAFIREHSHEQWPPPDPGREQQKRTTRPDIQAALTVIGRRERRLYERAPIDLSGANLPGVDFFGNLAGALLAETDFTGANLTNSIFVHATLARANFTGAILFAARLQGAILNDAHLDSARLAQADLSGTYLNGTDFTGAYLGEARLVKAAGKANFAGADLSKADLRDAHFNYANFDGATLRDANLSGTNLESAHLHCKSFPINDLKRTSLDGAYWPPRIPEPEGYHRHPESEKLEFGPPAQNPNPPD